MSKVSSPVVGSQGISLTSSCKAAHNKDKGCSAFATCHACCCSACEKTLQWYMGQDLGSLGTRAVGLI